MGMSASQARFLMLTARKNNVEFEGQQINQQRTTLSNESASYYAELCNMVVPTPPSIDDYTKVTYTFDDGALKNTITAMVAKNDGRYSVNYVQQWQDDYAIVSASSSMVAKSANGVYKVGSTTLRQLGKAGGTVNATEIKIDGVTYPIINGPNGPSIEEVTYVPGMEDCDPAEINRFVYFAPVDPNNAALQNLDLNTTEMTTNGDGTFLFKDAAGNEVTLQMVNKNPDGTFGDDNQTLDENNMIIVLPNADNTDISYVTPNGNGGYQKEALVEDKQLRPLTEPELASISTFEDPYLASLEPDQVRDLLEQEENYRILLNERHYNNPASDKQWYVRYVKDSTTGSYVPFFYNMDEVNGADYETNGFANQNFICYSIGSTTKTKEVIDALASVEKDTTGRYVSLLLYRTDEDGNETFTQYALTTNTSQDEEAYNDAMNKYNYAQYQYDQKVQEINSKIEILQQQDKSLELELKHLDTEESAISTEMEAVKKVISKNIESSFKTFNA